MNVGPSKSSLALVLSLFVAMAVNSSAQQQVVVAEKDLPLDRGHRLLLERGLQIQGLVFPMPGGGFNLDRWYESNLTTVNLWGAHNKMDRLGEPPGIPWSSLLFSRSPIGRSEQPYKQNLVSLQFGDELWINNVTVQERVAKCFEAWREKIPNTIIHTNERMGGAGLSDEEVRQYMQKAKPDILMDSVYPWRNDFENYLSAHMYGVLQRYRLLALGGYDGSGRQPIPYACYPQSFEQPPAENIYWRVPSDSDMRLNIFSALTFGYKFVSWFVYNGDTGHNVGPGLFYGLGDEHPRMQFYWQAETNRQCRNLGDALVRLLSTDVRFVAKQHKVPLNVKAWDKNADPYITDVNATNLGSLNGGKPSDVVIGYFKSLHESFDGPDYTGEIYFMVLNGLRGAKALVSEARQRIDITFDFGTSGISSLQRLSRDKGGVDVVELKHLDGSVYKLELVLDGGTADLFKFNTGAPFINGPYKNPMASKPFPRNYARLVPLDAELSWKPGEQAKTHNLYFGLKYEDIQEGRRPFKTGLARTVNKYKLKDFRPNTTYYWRVDEVNDTKVWEGKVWSFTTLGLPIKASVLSPFDGAYDVSVDADLNWMSSGSADNHDIYFGIDQDALAKVSEKQNGRSYEPGQLKNDTVYYWRVDERNGNGVARGDIWSFRTAGPEGPRAICGKNIKALASSMYGGQRDPKNTINGLGLEENGVLHTQFLDHMWMSKRGGGGGALNPSPSGSRGPAWIAYRFDEVYNLYEMWVWNHNQAGHAHNWTGRGMRKVSIEYSADGSSWRKLGDFELARAPGACGYRHNTEVNFKGVAAKYVVITAHEVDGCWKNDDRGNLYGLSEVLFFGALAR